MKQGFQNNLSVVFWAIGVLSNQKYLLLVDFRQQEAAQCIPHITSCTVKVTNASIMQAC